jgi:hypothetical protein
MRKQKIHDYVVVLKNQNRPLIERTGWLLTILALIILSINALFPFASFPLYLCIAIVLILAISNAIEKRKKKPIRFHYILITSGIGLIAFGEGFNSNVLFILLGIAEGFLLQKTEIGFSETGIVRSGWRSKHTPWSDLQNVLIRDGWLTIDFKDNQILQMETDDQEDDEYEVEDDEFNTYCQRMLNR